MKLMSAHDISGAYNIDEANIYILRTYYVWNILESKKCLMHISYPGKAYSFELF